jgi:hypothetical protein
VRRVRPQVRPRRSAPRPQAHAHGRQAVLLPLLVSIFMDLRFWPKKFGRFFKMDKIS